MTTGQTRELAGYRAIWEQVALPGGHSVGAWILEDLEARLDRQALLNSERVPEPPYWALVWIGARALAAEVMEAPPSPETRVLDLGCGLGLSGLAAAQAGAHVTFSDYIPECMDFVCASAETHGLTSYECRVADFTRDNLGARYDLILAADIVYDPAHYQPLAAFLEAHLADGGTILLTESLRADAKNFLTMMLELGFIDDCSAAWVDEDGQRERTWTHRLRRKPGG